VKRVVHIVVGVLSWVLVIGLWVVLIRMGEVTVSGVGKAAIQLGVLTATVLALTVLWVRHNIAIYRKKGPRTGRERQIPNTDRDRLGHLLTWDVTGGVHGARTVRHLVVDLAGETKTYRRGN